PIPGNDDAIRSVSTLTRVVADAVAEGLLARSGAATADEKPEATGQVGADEPLADWERELLQGGGDAAATPAAETPAAEAPAAESPAAEAPAAEAPAAEAPAAEATPEGDAPA